VTTLITKYRPKKFDDVIGQGSQVASLKKAIEKGTSQTILLTGPTGVGKTTLARIAASVAGCKAGDIMEVDAATHTGIDDMRDIAEGMSFAPLVGKAKAIILDEAHALSKPAVTSLLKALEEPPDWGWWFMCTTEPTKIPVAIRRRCLHLTLKPIHPDVLSDYLTTIIASERKKPGPDQAKIIDLCAAEAQGSPGQALANLAACLEVKSVEEASEMLHSAFETPQAYQLAQLLAKGANWRECQSMLKMMKDQNAESVRQVIRAYMTTMALNIPRGDKLQQALAVLEAFEQPCNSMDGISPIVIRCARLLS